MKLRHSKIAITLLITTLFIIGLAFAGCKTSISGVKQTTPKEESKAKDKPIDKPKEEAKDGEKEFSEIIKDCKPITGLFTIYFKEKDGSAYLEILPENIDKIFLCTITRESADGTFMDSASLGNGFPFFFKKINKRIQLIHKNVLFRADRDQPIFRAIEKGVSDSMVASSPILSKPMSPTGAVLVKLADFFITDRQNISQRLSRAANADFGLNKDDSYFSILKSFPTNTDIETTLYFSANKPVSSPTSPDARNIILKYYYSISKLPEPGYVPRLADDRVGHFITMYQDYNSVRAETPYVRYAERWRLEKADPAAELSPPKTPIVYWLEKTIPVEYRDSIRKGILLWNKAFEKAGFKDAIVVKQQPDDADWDPADIRYNVVRWMFRPGSGYAVGPSNADPFTGEIYNADIRISADMMRFFYNQFEEYVNPLRNSKSQITNPNSQIFNSEYCDYATGLMQQAAFGWSLLEAREFLDGKEADMEKFVQDYLVGLACHEIGHTLGLRHNFKASSIRTVEQLNNKEFTSKEGLTGSMMEYNPVNISLDPKEQGEYWQSTVGPYDCWVIEYAYKPFNAKSPDEELPKLIEIANRSSNPDLTYGTDEDAAGNSPDGFDPHCATFDSGNNLVEFADIRIKLTHELWNKIDEKFSKSGARYPKMRRVFGLGIGEYYRAASLVVRYVGGIYHQRDHIGAGTVPMKPVEAAKQKEALDFIIGNIFSLSEKDMPRAELLNKLAPDMLPDFGDASDHKSGQEVQLHNAVLSIQKNILDYLFSPAILTRLGDAALRSGHDEKFGLEELFTGLRQGIWSELESSNSTIPNPQSEIPVINSFRRNLQREFTDRLINIFRAAPDDIPSDAISLARSNLAILANSISLNKNKAEIDSYTKAHLEDILNRITAALEWKGK